MLVEVVRGQQRRLASWCLGQLRTAARAAVACRNIHSVKPKSVLGLERLKLEEETRLRSSVFDKSQKSGESFWRAVLSPRNSASGQPMAGESKSREATSHLAVSARRRATSPEPPRRQGGLDDLLAAAESISSPIVKQRRVGDGSRGDAPRHYCEQLNRCPPDKVQSLAALCHRDQGKEGVYCKYTAPELHNFFPQRFSLLFRPSRWRSRGCRNSFLTWWKSQYSVGKVQQ